MRLVRVRLEGYRAIRSLELAFEPELTALIGENGFGKTSLLDALLTVLGPGGELVFRAADFHTPPPPRAPAERIELLLTFVETRPEERALRPALAAAFQGPPGAGVLVVRIAAPRPFGDAAEVPGEAEFLDGEGRPLALPTEARDAALDALRQACPIVVLHAGRYVLGPTRGARPRARRRTAAAHDAGLTTDRALERRVLEAFVGVEVHGDEPTPVLEAGIDAARALVRRYAAPLAARRAALRPTRVLESLAQAPGGRSRVAPEVLLRDPGGGAQGLAALLVLGGLFEAQGDAPLRGDADPLVVLENPEAHLHPIVAANASRLVDGLPVQRLLTTNSPDLLSTAPLSALRRAVRDPDGEVDVFHIARRALSLEEQRRVGYHVRGNRADALFARCWLLVEGETEFWLIPELARVLGVDLPSEGVRVVEFAQCGVEPLVKLARAMGLGWHLLTDGDEAGAHYAAQAQALAQREGVEAAERITRLEAEDVERCLWDHGFDLVYRRAADLPDRPPRGRRGPDPRKVIDRAIDRMSKPRLALEVLEDAVAKGPERVPPPLRSAIEAAVRLARASACGWEAACDGRRSPEPAEGEGEGEGEAAAEGQPQPPEA